MQEIIYVVSLKMTLNFADIWQMFFCFIHERILLELLCNRNMLKMNLRHRSSAQIFQKIRTVSCVYDYFIEAKNYKKFN